MVYIKVTERKKLLRQRISDIPVKKKPVRFKDLNPHLYEKEELRTLTQNLIDKYGKQCMKCLTTESMIVLDHILARFKGGTNDIENLQLLCWKCNFNKGLQTADYRPWLYTNICYSFDMAKVKEYLVIEEMTVVTTYIVKATLKEKALLQVSFNNAEPIDYQESNHKTLEVKRPTVGWASESSMLDGM
jgi:5-methylcytosine-specific restriction endonuclease McrA